MNERKHFTATQLREINACVVLQDSCQCGWENHCDFSKKSFSVLFSPALQLPIFSDSVWSSALCPWENLRSLMLCTAPTWVSTKEIIVIRPIGALEEWDAPSRKIAGVCKVVEAQLWTRVGGSDLQAAANSWLVRSLKQLPCMTALKLKLSTE